MRTINLMMHQQSISHLLDQSEYLCNLYGRLESNYDGKVTKLKEEEDLCILVSELSKRLNADEQMRVLNGYYWNYSIPRIGKEFDLIRIGKEYLINIEIKSSSTDEKMKSQLEKNKRYLNIMGKQVYLFTFCSSSRTLYTLENENFRSTSFDELISLLQKQEVDREADIDELFSPVQFLISPFNNTSRFLSNEYFLTTQQEMIFNEITQFQQPYHEILGRVGTGKSLLLYHIAKSLMENPAYQNHVALIHCGILNDGHRILKQYGYRIYSADEWMACKDVSNVNVLCVDEFQRIHADQMKYLMEAVSSYDMKLIVSVDPVQVFNTENVSYEMCKNRYAFKVYKLSDHIRSNPDISRFSKDVMDLREHHGKISYEHIRIHGADSIDSARKMIRLFQSEGYCLIHYDISDFENTSSKNEVANIHHVIGQEYDKVITFLDETFYYTSNHMLNANSQEHSLYIKSELFYQAVTRTRKDLVVIVINNPDVLMSILSLF